MKEIAQLKQSHSSVNSAIDSCEILLEKLKDAKTAINSEELLRTLLFQLDLYTIHSDENLLKSVHEFMEYYHENCQKSDDDYAFGTGKLGFLYVATRLFEIEKDRHFLDKAIVLIEERINNFIISPYTNNSIHSGRSGSLLVLNYYEDVTNDPKAKIWIKALLQQLISQGQFSDKGVFWEDRVEKLHGLLNFEYGNAGIGYTFLKLGNRYKNDDFLTLAKQIYKHQCQFWNADLGWKATKKGIASAPTYKAALKAIQEENSTYFEPLLHNIFIQVGVTKFSLHLWKTVQDDALKSAVIKYLANCKEVYLNSKAQLSIKKALMLGTLFLEAAKILEDNQYLTEAKEIADFIKNKEVEETKNDFDFCVLKIKIGHFQLALENPLIDNSLVPTCDVEAKNNTEKLLNLDVKENLLKNTFNRTLTFLKTIDENLITEYLAQPIKDKAVFDFILFIKKKLSGFPPIQKKQLSEILKLEISRYNLKKGIQNYAHLEAKNIHAYQTVQALFNKPDEELGTTVLQINKNAKMLTTDWNWEVKQGVFSVDSIQNEASKANVFLLPYYKNIVTEYWQNPYNIVLNHFENQTEITAAITQMKQFYIAKDKIYIDKFCQYIMAESTYALQHLDTIILNIIKEYMAIGLLEIVPNAAKITLEK
ncbi:hypothetical protein H2O64_23480 [Kordia sp. YSTF-M3]|uniref:Lanthionine synthetase C-like protein n=1 Tax=Kordia aestuariivivens TaxID=2759037 RepID=A0ABR7QGE5_9FLAO|nr:lanthionine synthetase LanC family protein [Kordia aestuariivivens]MBC8757650.1 hypothetical protein [Kordia aestuariivivens]